MLSIVITWRDRKELARTLPKLLPILSSVPSEIIVVNFGGSTTWLHKSINDILTNIRVLSFDSEQFNKSKAQNLGASAARFPYLFFCDCDILFSDKSIEELFTLVKSDDTAFGTFAGVRETELNTRKGNHVTCFGYELIIRTKDGVSARIVDNEEDTTAGTRQAPGLLMVRRQHFEQINGYNSSLVGWGWEDQDIICRLLLGAKLKRIIHGSALHVSHDDSSRVQAYPIKNRWESRDRMFRQALANYDAANFLGTLSSDVQLMLQAAND